ncbi:endonuclease III [Tessaracoccus lubricantis]|uniref:Endonuclease III n=1 Tax=Tessaracoccus lubricantis TaxID=545543 RepID=A0ABP9F1S9_9ACTN
MDQPAIINETLADTYPDARCELDVRNPFELLVATVLSAQSTDRRVNAVCAELFARFPDATALAEANREEVETIIGPVGFYRNKTTAIIGLSQRIADEFDGEVPGTLNELVTLPGVGRKTANVVLGNAFGVPGITPDTHLIRLANRFGWVDSTKPDVVEQAVGELFPPEEWVMLCHRVIWHGRRCCHARRPACGACAVAQWCPSRDIGEQDPVKAAALIREPRN